MIWTSFGDQWQRFRIEFDETNADDSHCDVAESEEINAGASCDHCGEHFEYAERPESGEFKCHSCKENPWRPKNGIKNDNRR